MRKKASGGTVLSFGQEQMLTLQSLNPDSGFYNQPLVLGLHGPVDAALLQRCIQGIVGRHDVLRTRYTRGKDGSWKPDVLGAESAEVKLSTVDLSHTEVSALEESGCFAVRVR